MTPEERATKAVDYLLPSKPAGGIYSNGLWLSRICPEFGSTPERFCTGRIGAEAPGRRDHKISIGLRLFTHMTHDF